jgi:hypothetical protein
VVTMKITVFSDVTTCSLVDVYRNFGRTLVNIYRITRLFFPQWLYSPLGPLPLIFSFMIILQTVGLPGRVISSSQGLYLNTGQYKHRINTYTYQTSVPYVGFGPTIPASERAKTVHALARWATCGESARL